MLNHGCNCAACHAKRQRDKEKFENLVCELSINSEERQKLRDIASEILNNASAESQSVSSNESEKKVCDHQGEFISAVGDCYCDKCKQWKGISE